MLTKAQIKLVSSLKHKKERNTLGFFVIEGEKLFSELLISIYKAEYIFAEKSWLDKNPIENAVGVSYSEMERLTHLSTPSPILAVVSIEKSQSPIAQKGDAWLALDAISDPGNLGTIVRIADWFNFKGILCFNQTTDLFNTKALMASMGSCFRIPVYYFEEFNILDEFKKADLPFVSTLLSGENLINYTKKEGIVLFIGNESRGLDPLLASKCEHSIKIQSWGKAESLNAAVSTGIICNHLRMNSLI